MFNTYNYYKHYERTYLLKLIYYVYVYSYLCTHVCIYIYIYAMIFFLFFIEILSLLPQNYCKILLHFVRVMNWHLSNLQCCIMNFFKKYFFSLSTPTFIILLMIYPSLNQSLWSGKWNAFSYTLISGIKLNQFPLNFID